MTEAILSCHFLHVYRHQSVEFAQVALFEVVIDAQQVFLEGVECILLVVRVLEVLPMRGRIVEVHFFRPSGLRAGSGAGVVFL